jgi:ABC-type molybdate transport system substrate-binding protein
MDMRMERRVFLAAAPVAALAGATRAVAGTTDLAVSCDFAAAPAVRRAAQAFRARSGVRIRVFPTANGLLLPQLQREIQNDIIVTAPATLDAADKVGVIKPGARSVSWRNRLVVAEGVGGPAGSFAIPDPTPASAIDGPAVLQALGLMPAHVQGVVDTGAVAWMLANGEVAQGLVLQTEVAADNRLRAVSPVPDAACPPVLYAASVTTLASRGDPAAFVAFLGSSDGFAALHEAGLEAVA